METGQNCFYCGYSVKTIHNFFCLYDFYVHFCHICKRPPQDFRNRFVLLEKIMYNKSKDSGKFSIRREAGRKRETRKRGTRKKSAMKRGTIKKSTIKKSTIKRNAWTVLGKKGRIKRWAALMAAASFLLLLSGCSQPDASSRTLEPPAEDARLHICTSLSPSVYEPIVREFEARTGIWVTVETGETLELLEEIRGAEGSPDWDLLFGARADSLAAHTELFSAYQSSLLEEMQITCLPPDGTSTPFSIVPLVLIYNPKLARVHPPSGMDSLLDPAWMGRIAFADPSASDASYTVLASLLQALPGSEEEILRAFAANLGGKLLASSSDVIREVANGNCYIGITGEDDALRAMEAGYDIAVVYPSQGVCAVADGAAVLKGCAHEENAQAFIDFLLSQDAQEYIRQTCLRRPVSGDLLPEGAEADFDLFPYDLVLSSESQEEILQSWEQIWEEERQ